MHMSLHVKVYIFVLGSMNAYVYVCRYVYTRKYTNIYPYDIEKNYVQRCTCTAMYVCLECLS